MSISESELLNVIILGLAFLFLCGGYQTANMVEEIIIQTAARERNATMTGEGFLSQSLTSGSYALFSWFSPIIQNYFGQKYSMCMCVVAYIGFILALIKPIKWSLYVASIALGMASAVLWNCQALYIAIISTPDTVNRNAGIFWSLYQCNMLLGSLLQYFIFSGASSIKRSTRHNFLFILIASIILGLILLLSVKNVRGKSSQIIPVSEGEEEEETRDLSLSLNNDSVVAVSDYELTAWQIFTGSFRFLFTRQVFFLLFTFIFTGVHLTFVSSLFGICIGQTLKFGSSALSDIGLIGAAIGVGEILGGVGCTWLASLFGLSGRMLVMVISCCIQVFGYFCVYLTLPADSPLHPSNASTFIEPNLALLIICALFFGAGDATFNTHLLTAICDHYSQSAQICVFAIFNFSYSFASMIAFLYSGYLTLTVQLAILCLCALFGTVSFIAFDSQPILRLKLSTE